MSGTPQTQKIPLNLEKTEGRLKALMNNKIPALCHDVTFLVGQLLTAEKISCHKFVLASISEVFEKMLFGELQERGEIIAIPDVEPKAFRNILKFAYLRIAEVDINDAVATMYAATKYELPELIAHCSVILQQNINEENAVALYQAATLLDHQELKNKSLAFSLKKFKTISQTPAFLDLTEANLSEILKSDDLIVNSELNTFNAVIRWAHSKYEDSWSKDELRNILSDVIKHVRFPLMDPATILEHVEPTGVLDAKEIVVLMKYFHLTPEKRNACGDTEFNHQCRKCNALKFSTDLEFSLNNTTLIVGQSAELYFRFSDLNSNVNLYLQEIELFCDAPGTSDDCSVNVELIPHTSPNTITKIATLENIQPKSLTKSIRVNDKIKIVQNVEHQIVVKVVKGTLGVKSSSGDGYTKTNADNTQGALENETSNVQIEFYTGLTYLNQSNIRSLQFTKISAN